ncbi:MAG: hypothetical protein ACLQHK_00450 [Gallionellaceae bacterium]
MSRAFDLSGCRIAQGGQYEADQSATGDTEDEIFEEAYAGWNAGRLAQTEAARILGVCVCSFRRHMGCNKTYGLDGLSGCPFGAADDAGAYPSRSMLGNARKTLQAFRRACRRSAHPKPLRKNVR